jgi:hypothetical protein
MDHHRIVCTVVDHDDGPRRKMHHHNSSSSHTAAPAAARSSLRVVSSPPYHHHHQHHLVRPSDERYQKIKKKKTHKNMISSKLFLLILTIGVIGLTTFSSLAILLEAQQQQSSSSSSSQLRSLSLKTTNKKKKNGAALETQPPPQHEDDNDDDTAATATSAAAAKMPQRQLLPRADQRGSWIGDVWVPPVGWTLYNAPDLVQLWGVSTNGILWIGDSTARRSSLTLWEILHHGGAGADGTGNATTTNSSTTTTTTTTASSSSSAQTTTIDIAKDLLEANDHINVNHKGHALEKCHAWPRIKGADICRTLPLPVSSSSSASSSSSSLSSAGVAATPPVVTTTTTARPFVFKRLNCYQEVTQFLQHEMSQPDSVLHHVDTIVLALGLWDITMAHQCGIAPSTNATTTTAPATTVDGDSNNNNNTSLPNTTRDRQQHLLETLYQLPARFTILWRTTSYANPEDALAIDQYNQYAMDEMDHWWWTKEQDMDKASDRDQPPPPPAAVRRPNVHYVDFARVIFPRSFGKDRIQGDHYAHYGSTARVVLIQMLSNLLEALYQTKKKTATAGAGTISRSGGELEIALAAGRSVDPQ